jgi:uroporphyrinogen III methyltransferase/synthase
VAADISPEEISHLLTPPPDAITFTSSSTATNFARLLGQERLAETLRSVAIASIGPVTSETLRQLGLTITLEARKSTIPGLVEVLQLYFTRN